MYNLKRILTNIIHDSSVTGAPAMIPPIREAAKEALTEVERIEKDALDTPQEMRDVFAACALLGLLAHPDPHDHEPFLVTQHEVVAFAWKYSDLMMLERTRRIVTRQHATPQADSMGE